MARRMLCGHNSDWTVRLVDRGQRYVYCLGCLFEKMNMKTVDGREPPKIVSQKDKEKEKQDVKDKKPEEAKKDESDT